MDGSGTYALERAPLQGTAGEPKWLGIIQHDMMLFDHGMPPGPKQSPKADINIEYQRDSRMAAESRNWPLRFRRQTGHTRGTLQPIGANMAGTDSIRFQDLRRRCQRARKRESHGDCPWVQTRIIMSPQTNMRIMQKRTFVFGFNSAQTTLGGLASLAGITLVRPRRNARCQAEGRTAVHIIYSDPASS